LRWLIISLGIFSTLAVLYSIFSEISSLSLVLSYFFLALSLLTISFSLYIRYLKDHPLYLLKGKTVENGLDLADFDLVKALLAWRRHPQVRSLFNELYKVPSVMMVFGRLGIGRELINSILPETENSDSVSAAIDSLITKNELITPLSFLQEMSGAEGLQQLLQTAHVNKQDFKNVIEFYLERDLAYRLERQEHYSNHYSKTGGIAKDWSTSYTNILDQYAARLDYSIVRRSRLVPIFSRIKIVDQSLIAFEKSAGNHVLLVGEEGSGRTEIFLALAARILSYETKTSFDGFQVRILDSERLISVANNNNEVIQIIERVIDDAIKAGNVILYFDQLERLIDPNQGEGHINIESVLGRYLSRPELRIIASTLPDAQIELVKNNQLLRDHFTSINVPPPEGVDLTNIILTDIGFIENKYGVFFLYQAIKSVAALASRYVKDESSPVRELNILESASAAAHRAGLQIIDESAIQKVIEEKSHVPIQVNQQEQQTLLNLEPELHKRIIGQDEAIKQLSDALVRSRAGISSASRPIASFMFLGPTGVGKTETAKALAQIYFGDESKMIRLDMAEFNDQNALTKLLGVEKVSQPGALYDVIQKNPSSVLLLDEIEKASRETQNALLSLIDEGRITTSFGKVLDFTNTIIIASSNAGSDYIVDQTNKKVAFSSISKNLIDFLMGQKIFLPEFLNRFDGLIIYTPLTQNQMRSIVQIQLDHLSIQLQAEKQIELNVSPAVLDQLTKMGYDPVFGARALQRVMRSTLETAIARELIAQQPPPGSKITISSL